jgi:hypothetical protein
MRVPFLVIVIAALALPAVAAAKEVTALDVCGTDGCTQIVDRDALRAFEQGSELAEAAPAGRQRSYLLRVRIRDEAGKVQVGWTTLWLPKAGVVALDDGHPGATFSPVGPALERVLRHAVRGHTARAARDYSVPPPSPVARVADVVPAPPARSADAAPSGPPALAWTGLAAVVLLAGGALRARQR